jgi:Rap1a immunity proteins
MRIALLLTWVILATWPARGETALQVQSWCRKISNTRVGAENKFLMRKMIDDGFCWGAFAEIQAITDFQNEDGSKLLALCVPDGATRIELTRVFVQYADRHPELGHLNFAVVADQALREVFLCPQGKPN